MKRISYLLPTILFLFLVNYSFSQCLTMACPPSTTVNAAANACAATVAYTTPTVNCSNCTSNTQTFNYTGVMQNFTVPAGITSINILVKGAQGGKHTSSAHLAGLGAGMRGTFAVIPGTVLKVLVGECPSITTGGGNGGGGGSFVTTLANSPLIIAGGGGGSCLTTSTIARDGNITTTGGTGACAGGTGGTAGNGGNVGAVGFQSGAGGGLLTNGATGWSAGSGGNSFITGGAGGLVAAWAFARGGYGGGGQGSAYVVGGGGGGYSGGGGGGNNTPGGGNGGGGASYNIGTCQSNTTGINVGHGSVVFSWGTSTVIPVMTAGLASGSSFPVGTTVQTFTAGDSFGNTTSCSFSVTVKDITTPTITCPGNISQCNPVVTGIAPVLVLDNCPSPAVTYSFSGATTGSGVNNASGSVFNVGSTTVTYIATDISGNIGSCSFVVTTGVSPTISATATNSSVCIGGSTTLNGVGAVTYTWSGGITNGVPFSPTITTTYTLTGTSASGCTNTALATITVNPLPVIITNSPTTCSGSNINLTANGGAGYSWTGPLGYTSLVQNPVITNATTGMSGLYTVTVTSAAGCTASANASVTVVNLPVAVLNSNSPVCLGGALTFTASGGTINLTGPNGFSSASTNPTITNVTALANGNYTLIVAAGTCTASTTSAVVINPLPVPIANSNSPVCLNQPINFTGSGGTTYTWTGPGAYNSAVQNPAITNTSAANAGTYTLSVTNANGCTNTITTNVVVNPLPIIAALSNPTVCLNTTINLAANGGVGYSWTGPLGFVSLVQNPSIANATAPMSGIYTVMVTSAAGCTNTAMSTVNVLPLPIPVIVSNTPCVGSTLNLNGSGGSIYSWSGPNGFNSLVQNPSIANVTLPASGNYTLLATVGTCSASIVQPITINSLPTPIAGNNAPICETNNLVLTGNGGGNYSWAGPLGFTSALQNPTITNALNTHSGNYVLTVIDANGCQANATTSVTILANPSALANGAIVCVGQPANLNASGGVSYSWTGPNGFTSNIANPVIPSVTANNTGNYVVTVTGVNTCTSVTAVNVSSNPLPVPTITSTAKTCLNTAVSLQGSNGFLLYQWTGPNNFLSANPTTGFTATSMNQNGLYVYSVTDNNGCTGSTSTLVVIDPLPVGTLVSDGKNSCVPFCANFSVTAGVGSSPIAFTSWQLNNQTLVGSTINYCFINGGSYPVNASFTDNNGCSNSATFAINAYAAPHAGFEFSPIKPVENIDNVIFSNTSTGLNNISWNWYFINNNGYTSIQQNTSYLFNEAGTYPVAMIVQNKWGCSDTIVKMITIAEEQTLYVPNSFTPNDDGINDVFLPKGKGIVKYNLLVFDRWGQKIYETSDFSVGWDGAFKGLECKEDIYVWKITASFSQGKVKEYTGHVTLNR